jgi:hypothetical protein
MKKLFFCLMATCLLFILIPFQLNAQPTIISDSLDVSKPVEHAENRSVRLGIKRINMMDTTKFSLFEKEKLQTEEQSSKRHRHVMNGTLYISYGIELLITMLVIILL